MTRVTRSTAFLLVLLVTALVAAPVCAALAAAHRRDLVRRRRYNGWTLRWAALAILCLVPLVVSQI